MLPLFAAIVFPVSFAVAEVEGAPVASRATLEVWLAEANRIYAPADVQFVLAEVRPLAAAHAHLETRADRHALGAHHRAGVINAFVVARLRDVDEPPRLRKGVHWRPRRPAGAHFVIVSSDSPPSVLAHELGHFFGHAHVPEVDNIMSYERTGAPPFFTAEQLRHVRVEARRFVTTRELRPVTAPGPLKAPRQAPR